MNNVQLGFVGKADLVFVLRGGKTSQIIAILLAASYGEQNIS